MIITATGELEAKWVRTVCEGEIYMLVCIVEMDSQKLLVSYKIILQVRRSSSICKHKT